MFEEFINPKKLKKEMLQATFFVILYENFKKNWKEEILAFSANEVKFEDHDFLYCFSMPNPDNPNAFKENDFVKDKAMENKFKNEVYRTVKSKMVKIMMKKHLCLNGFWIEDLLQKNTIMNY